MLVFFIGAAGLPERRALAYFRQAAARPPPILAGGGMGCISKQPLLYRFPIFPFRFPFLHDTKKPRLWRGFLTA